MKLQITETLREIILLPYKAKTAIEESRSAIAATINAKNSEIFFTSGGSEADNWALKGIFNSHKSYQPHIITSQIEHSAILNSCHFLEKTVAKSHMFRLIMREL